jgi:predicted GIY-YIG superfamily endonuclease
MAGLVPAIPLGHAVLVRQFYLYILASRPGGAIYIGVTSNLIRRVYEHRNGFVEVTRSAITFTNSFTSKSFRRRAMRSSARKT